MHAQVCTVELHNSTAVFAEMPEVMEAARRAQGDASCTTGQIPSAISQVSFAPTVSSATSQFAQAVSSSGVLQRQVPCGLSSIAA